VNCRTAEVSVFPKSPVAQFKRGVVEARLHFDTKNELLRDRVLELFEIHEVGDTRPLYVLLDPETEEVLAQYNGAPVRGDADKESFIEFLNVIQ